MRDIRVDLQERLAILDGRFVDVMADYDKRRAALESAYYSAMEAIRRERETVEQLMNIENERQDMESISFPRQSLMPLVDFLFTKICVHGPVGKEQLKVQASAAGYFDESNARAFHTTLFNILRSGKIVQIDGGKFIVPDKTTSKLDMRENVEAERE